MLSFYFLVHLRFDITLQIIPLSVLSDIGVTDPIIFGSGSMSMELTDMQLLFNFYSCVFGNNLGELEEITIACSYCFHVSSKGSITRF